MSRGIEREEEPRVVANPKNRIMAEREALRRGVPVEYDVDCPVGSLYILGLYLEDERRSDEQRH